jgi:uncharacterized Fe-S center protein
MKPSEVYFIDYKKSKKISKEIESIIIESGLNHIISRGKPVAIKLHMGEAGNITSLRPIFARKVVDTVKEAGGKPFITDTTTLYPDGRFTANDYLKTAACNGFTEESMGVPIIIADGNEGYDGLPVHLKKRIQGCKIREIKVASGITQADSMIVLSHVKGHLASGFAGALKNVAMGCVTKDSKAVQHSAHPPILDESKCDGCGTCVEVCPFCAMNMKFGKPERDIGKCMYCLTCFFNCSKEALRWPKRSDTFQVNLVHTANAVLTTFRKGKVGFLNFIQDVTPLCDCVQAGLPVVQDVGILASLDPVAIDKAALDLVDQAPIIPGSTAVKPPDILGKINEVNSLVQIKIGEKLNLGTSMYRLIDILK